MKREIQQGEACVWWYGVAWEDFSRLVYVCYPIPINLILRWLRNIWSFAFYPKNHKEKEAYQLGYKKGRESFSTDLGKAILKERNININK